MSQKKYIGRTLPQAKARARLERMAAALRAYCHAVEVVLPKDHDPNLKLIIHCDSREQYEAVEARAARHCHIQRADPDQIAISMEDGVMVSLRVRYTR